MRFAKDTTYLPVNEGSYPYREIKLQEIMEGADA
jgi:hypothetical protein